MDNSIFDSQQDHNNVQDFVRPVLAGVVGAYIGHKLDQTRFGVWVNTNRTIDTTIYWIKIVAIFAITIAVLLYAYIFLTTPMIG